MYNNNHILRYWRVKHTPSGESAVIIAESRYHAIHKAKEKFNDQLYVNFKASRA